jgi:GntR family transcriptional regulator, transcriptional repressor for pyruvate dehydrogenase complex
VSIRQDTLLPSRGTRGEVAEELRRRIRGGELPQGQRLPSERELAEELAVSRTTVREALQALREEGFITAVRGRAGGNFVTDLILPQELWYERIRQNPGELDELFDYRIALETRSAFLAAGRRDRSDLAAMRGSIQMLKQRDAYSASDYQVAFRRADAAFHEAIAQASRNERLSRAIRAARGDIFFPFDWLPHPVYVAPTLEGHAMILQAIRSGDARSAARAMESHLERTRIELGTIILMMTGRMSDGRTNGGSDT